MNLMIDLCFFLNCLLETNCSHAHLRQLFSLSRALRGVCVLFPSCFIADSARAAVYIVKFFFVRAFKIRTRSVPLATGRSEAAKPLP